MNWSTVTSIAGICAMTFAADLELFTVEFFLFVAGLITFGTAERSRAAIHQGDTP